MRKEHPIPLTCAHVGETDVVDVDILGGHDRLVVADHLYLARLIHFYINRRKEAAIDFFFCPSFSFI